MRGIRLYAIIAAAFMAGAFIASPELRAYAANTVGSADIINNSIQSVDIKDGEVKTADLGGNSVTSAKIKDGEVKAAEIATNAIGSSEIAADAVGASEIAGVSKLIFAECSFTNNQLHAPGFGFSATCSVPGAASSDNVLVTINDGTGCYVINDAIPTTNNVNLLFRNVSTLNCDLGTARISVMVYNS